MEEDILAYIECKNSQIRLICPMVHFTGCKNGHKVLIPVTSTIGISGRLQLAITGSAIYIKKKLLFNFPALLELED